MNHSFNSIIIIGNGFDKAHHLETSYEEFILYFFKKVFNKIELQKEVETPLFKYFVNNFNLKAYNIEFESIKDIDNFLTNHSIELRYYSSDSLIKSIIFSLKERRWVDIETEYYHLIKKHYKDSIPICYQVNKELDGIKKELISYLNQLDLNVVPFDEIKNHFKSLSIPPNNFVNKQTLVLNFNYTNTIKQYIDSICNLKDIISIHGDICDNNNPIIFGFGDENDPALQDIENTYDNELLVNLKTMSYHLTNNYKELYKFIELGHFNVFIMGHSCGISDRLLFSTVLNHHNCQEIQIFFHDKDGKYNDYYTKVLELYRHFDKGNKNLGRRKIVSLVDSKPLLKYVDHPFGLIV